MHKRLKEKEPGQKKQVPFLHKKTNSREKFSAPPFGGIFCIFWYKTYKDCEINNYQLNHLTKHGKIWLSIGGQSGKKKGDLKTMGYKSDIEIAQETVMEPITAIAEKETAGQTEAEDIINKGEASFFRAYCYFNLVRAFGEVPLVTYKINDASEANIPKTTADKIYEQIDKDLKTAEESLPETWSSEYTGRLTWGAARSLHARTYMMRNDWNNMYTASTDVIKKGLYNLKTPYNEIFTDDGENNGGSIFELQCTATAALPQSTVIGSQFCEVQGVRGAGQ